MCGLYSPKAWITGMAFATAFAIAIPAAAQQGGAPAGARGGADPRATAAAAMAEKIKQAAALPTPHTADGHPDLTGMWVGGGFGGIAPPPGLQDKAVTPDGRTVRAIAGAEDDEIKGDQAGVARRRADASLRPVYKPQYQATADENFVKAAHRDPSYRCMPDGVPRMGAPSEIASIPNAVILLYANKTTFRVVPTDNRPHDPDAEGMADGNAVGHWEGDTLVVDVTKFSPDTWLDLDGSFHDDNMHVVERFTRQGNTLRYEVTVEDPTLFAKPFSPKPRTLLLGKPSEHVQEDYPCVEMDQSHLTSDERH